MHIRDGILSSDVCIATGLLATAAVGYSIYRVRQRANAPSASQIGAVSGLVFAGQMVNFPLLHLPASGHFLGGVFAAALLGPWAGCLAITAVLLVQSIVFGDGGLTVLGANVLNMAVVGCWGGAAIMHLLNRPQFGRGWLQPVGEVSAALLSVVLAASVFCLEFAFSSSSSGLSLSRLTLLMLQYHLAIGVGEAIVTAAALALFMPRQASSVLSSSGVFGSQWLPAAILSACLIAVFLAPWASSYPDGLEAVAEQMRMNDVATDHPLLLADYELPLPARWSSLGVSGAGLFGTALTLALGSLVMKVLLPVRAGRVRVEPT